MRTIFERSVEGKRAWSLPESNAEAQIPERLKRKDPPQLPEVSEPELVRHYTNLSSLNFSIDNNFYPLGSCTMKHNPKLNEELAALHGFQGLHPDQSDEDCQGTLELIHTFEQELCEIAGMDAATTCPAAGAHGELTALLMFRKHFELTNQLETKTKILIPDSAHGTNPASVRLAGFHAVEVPSGPDGRVDFETFKSLVDENTAGLMITNPNTLGIFETQIEKIADRIHEVGGFVYCDGANLNAIVGRARPGDMGFDVVHMNLHKTFSTPHGGGGPGAGPICVKNVLADYLPVPRVIKNPDGTYVRQLNAANSIGEIHGAMGNVQVVVRAYAYLLRLGFEGLRNCSGTAVLNANYLKALIKDSYPIPYPNDTLHEFVASGDHLRKHGVRTFDIAKALLDYGFHAPTVYFPLTVREALMIEPTETESKETLDAFADALIDIANRAKNGEDDQLRAAPQTLSVTRLDEAKPARNLSIRAAKHP